jgi:hypothetical protein
MKYEYKVYVLNADDYWVKAVEGSLQFCRGYMYAKSDYAPRLAHRLVRSDGKIVEEFSANEDVSIGMIAGWPTAEQYVRAAARAMARAEAIR